MVQVNSTGTTEMFTGAYNKRVQQNRQKAAASNAEDIENKNVSKTEASGNTSQVELSSKAKSVLEQLAKNTAIWTSL